MDELREAIREFQAACDRRATVGTLYYGHKEKWGSVFLTSFALSLPVDIKKFLRELDNGLQHTTSGLTFVRLHEADAKPSKSGYPVLTVWWGGDRGHEPEEEGARSESELGGPWFVMDLISNAIQIAGRKMGFRAFKELGHSADAERV